ncbi:CPBP family intramembrane metalloprotease [Enterococcus faecalis]|uniref:CPBP family intramembrane metalloprotease n=1 Tax=Enterococcus faecalis TaxID=1351 RepID=UPI0022702C2E
MPPSYLFQLFYLKMSLSETLQQNLYFFMGFFFALLYKQTGKIWTSIIAHCGMNTIVIIVQLLLHNGTIQ